MWRTILEGKELLKQALRWRVGDDIKVYAWKDRWIKVPYDFKAP